MNSHAPDNERTRNLLKRLEEFRAKKKLTDREIREIKQEVRIITDESN